MTTVTDTFVAKADKKMDHNELRTRFLNFFQNRDHMVLPSAPLVPQNDKSTLFTTAGVQPLVPILKGDQPAPHSRLTDAQKCLRTNDIDDVGDKSHLTFFEMLGSWSVGSYDKKTAITYAHDFLTSQEGLNLPKERLWTTVFQGGNGLPRDEDAADVWKSLGIPAERIAYLPEEDNWWATGPEGLCGPDTEVFFDLQWPKPVPAGHNPGNDPDRRFIEIWNTVFMSFDKQGSTLTLLPTQNIDEGAGLERLLSVINRQDIYETSCFREFYDIARAGISPEDADKIKSARILSDHLRTSLMVLSEEPKIYPSATEQGYILRRLIRGAVTHGHKLGLDDSVYEQGLRIFSANYRDQYPETGANLDDKIKIFKTEQARFEKILARAPTIWDQFAKATDGITVPAENLFRMVTEKGIPLEVLETLAQEHGQQLDRQGFDKMMETHKVTSRAAPEMK